MCECGCCRIALTGNALATDFLKTNLLLNSYRPSRWDFAGYVVIQIPEVKTSGYKMVRPAEGRALKICPVDKSSEQPACRVGLGLASMPLGMADHIASHYNGWNLSWIMGSHNAVGMADID